MNKPLSATEIRQLAVPGPTAPPMTRREKLLRFAAIIRRHQSSFVIWDSLEYRRDEEYDVIEHPGSAFAAAAADPILRDAGLAGSTVGDGKRFFELTREELHVFSCNCGGRISNEDMARRIESIADNA